jgi:hypothetical protein
MWSAIHSTSYKKSHKFKRHFSLWNIKNKLCYTTDPILTEKNQEENKLEMTHLIMKGITGNWKHESHMIRLNSLNVEEPPFTTNYVFVIHVPEVLCISNSAVCFKHYTHSTWAPFVTCTMSKRCSGPIHVYCNTLTVDANMDGAWTIIRIHWQVSLADDAQTVCLHLFIQFLCVSRV